jgi:hypothetical protein
MQRLGPDPAKLVVELDAPDHRAARWRSQMIATVLTPTATSRSSKRSSEVEERPLDP